MSFNALLENINRKNRSYGQVGNQSPAARIQRMNPLLDVPSAVPIGPNVVSQVNVPGAQNIGAPQARGVPLLPFAQNMPAPAAQPMPVGEDVAPPNVIPLNTPATEEIEPTNIQLDDPEEVVSEDDTFFNQISRAASQGVKGVQQWASGVAQDDEKMGKLILALNSMRRKPDAGIAAAAREQIKGAQAERTSNRTIEYLKSQGASSTFMEIAKTDPNKALIEFEKSKKPVDRKTLEDAAGYKRYQDTGERVFPGAEKKKDRKTLEDAAGYKRYADTGERVFPDIDVPVDDSKNAYQAKSFALPDGTVVTGSFNPRAKPGSQFVDRAGNPLPMGARIISTQAQGTPDELGLTTSTQTSLEKQHIAMTSLERGLVQMQKILKQDPSVVGTKGQYSKYVGGALGQFEFTKPMIDMLNTSPELKQQYDSLGKSIVGQVSTLLQDDPSRKSDKDIQMAMDAMQTDSWISSPEQATVALRTLMKVVAEKKADVGNRLNPTDLKTKYNHLLKKGE